jgi:ABC-type nickel/cobalt efflux system permease component RcnA
LLAVGFAGGLVPSPSALVVLLGGIALGRTWFAVLLVLAYGIGMALALVGTGLLLVRARDLTERWLAAGHRAGRATDGLQGVVRALPVLTAALVVVVGVAVTGQSLARL